jgi:hypothetical protein
MVEMRVAVDHPGRAHGLMWRFVALFGRSSIPSAGHAPGDHRRDNSNYPQRFLGATPMPAFACKSRICHVRANDDVSVSLRRRMLRKRA